MNKREQLTSWAVACKVRAMSVAGGFAKIAASRTLILVAPQRAKPRTAKRQAWARSPRRGSACRIYKRVATPKHGRLHSSPPLAVPASPTKPQAPTSAAHQAAAKCYFGDVTRGALTSEECSRTLDKYATPAVK